VQVAVQLELAHAEAVRPNMRVNLGEAPLDGCMKELSLLAREGRNSPATGSTGFAYKRFGHIACLVSQPMPAPRLANRERERCDLCKLIPIDGTAMTADAAPNWIS